MIVIILSLVALVTAWYYFVRPFSYWKNRGVRQSNPWPIIGDSWRFMTGKTAFLDFLNWIYAQGKGRRYFGFYLFTQPVLEIYDPELIKLIMVKEFDSFLDHSQFTVDPEIDPTWGNNLLILRGQRWKDMRTTLSPSYTGSKMRVIYELMAETADNFVDYFLGKNKDLMEIEGKDIFSRFTNDVIATTAFGLKIDSLNNPDNDFYKNGKGITNLQSVSTVIKYVLLNLSEKTWKILGLRWLRREPVAYFKETLFDTIKQREENNIQRPDLLNVFIEAKKEGGNIKHGHVKQPMSEDEILAQALIFFLAGFETVSTSLAFGAYELAINKDVQDKLREEVKETYSKHGKVTYDILQEMKYMDMVISEILRKWPTFMVTDRLVTKKFTIEPVNKNEVPVTVEPGSAISFPIYHIQRDPQFFPNPDKFDPERFSAENKHTINPYAYIPFGSGPRICIGNRFGMLEIKCLLFKILLHFEFIPISKTPVPPKLKMPNIQYSMKGGCWIGLKRSEA